MAAKKKSAKKKASKKKGGKKKGAKKKAKSARQIFDDNLKALQKQLPSAAARRVGELRKTVKDIERQADKARGDAEKRMHKAEAQIRRDAVKMLRRVERAIEDAIVSPKKKKKKKKAAKKK